MSWIERKPITGKLPKSSGNWVGNRTVETLTGFWDDMLCDLKDYLDNPKSWLDISEMDSKFLDYVGAGLCGLGVIWDTNYPETVKRALIKKHQLIIRNRGSKVSIETLIDCLVPGSNLVHYSIPRADISLADFAQVSDYPTNRYMICLPTNLERNGIEFSWMRNAIQKFMPIGEVSLQYQVNLPNKTLAGDWSHN